MIVAAPSIAARCCNTRRQDCKELVTLKEHNIDGLQRREAHLTSKFEPRASLPELLETDAKLVNEVAARFGGLDFAIIREGRRAAPNQLKSDEIGRAHV